jgi:putative lipoic acid-binding regulatory protein
MKDQSMPEPSLELIEFPCRFPLKIMGERHDAFVATIVEVVRVHAPDLGDEDVVLRASSSGRYQSLTVTVTATSRAQLDTIYLALTSHAMVKVVL